MTGNDIVDIIRSNREFLASHGVKRMGLFGSFVRDEQREDSDVDLLVEFREGQKTYDNFIEVCFFLEDLVGRKVDLLTLESISPFIRPHIEKEVRYEVIH